MKALRPSKRFAKDVKLAVKRGKRMEKLQTILQSLASDQSLPPRCLPHKLSGDYADIWECHIEPDWLLLYDTTATEVLLFRTGTHADLFG